MEKRVIFTNGRQKEFLFHSKQNLKLTWQRFAEKLKINRTTLEKSYRYGYCSLPYEIFIKICKLRKISKNRILKSYKAKIINSDSLMIIGREVLGERRTKLPKPNILYKSLPLIFDTKKIELSPFDKNKNIKLPRILIPDLAEEIGIHLGDGFLSNKKFEYRLKGNKNEKEYYNLFIKPLYKKLFNLDINLKEYETTYGFELYSKAIWFYKTKILRIPCGKKHNILVPEIIKVNNKEILIAFIRGVFDTDGSISFINKYKKGNYYPTISLVLNSKNLINGIAEILSMLGLEPKVYKNGPYWGLYLNGYKRLETYLKVIGSNNPKNMDKIIKWKNQYPHLSKMNIINRY